MSVHVDYDSLRQAWFRLAPASLALGDGAALLREDPSGLGDESVASAYDSAVSTAASAIIAFGMTIDAYLEQLGDIEQSWRRADARSQAIAAGR